VPRRFKLGHFSLDRAVILAEPDVTNRSNICCMGGVWPLIVARRATSFVSPRSLFMEERALGTSTTIDDSKVSTTKKEDRNVWVLTAYAISGLALFGILIYYFSSYITQ